MLILEWADRIVRADERTQGRSAPRRGSLLATAPKVTKRAAWSQRFQDFLRAMLRGYRRFLPHGHGSLTLSCGQKDCLSVCAAAA